MTAVDDIKEMIALHDRGWSLAAIGRKFGIARSTVGDRLVRAGIHDKERARTDMLDRYAALDQRVLDRLTEACAQRTAAPTRNDLAAALGANMTAIDRSVDRLTAAGKVYVERVGSWQRRVVVPGVGEAINRPYRSTRPAVVARAEPRTDPSIDPRQAFGGRRFDWGDVRPRPTIRGPTW